MPTKKTSWGKVAGWYNDLLEQEPRNYQKDVILPNLMRCVGDVSGLKVADIACGQGFFSRAFAAAGAEVVASDISSELIEFAKMESAKVGAKISFFAKPADELPFLKDASVDVATIVLAIQNISNPKDVFAEIARVLKPDGRLFLVLNHPSFRIPKASDWGWDEERGVQYRRVDAYLSESKAKIDMHPGKANGPQTISYHRPLQFFVKSLARTGFCVTNIEEWVSDRVSDSGPRAAAENRARKEIPLFMLIETSRVARVVAS